MRLTYVLDTNVLLHNSNSIFAFEDNQVIIPLVVLDEIDRTKKGVDEIAKNARVVVRSLDKLRATGNLNKGVKINKNGILRVETNCTDNCPKTLDPTKADNQILSVALGLKKKRKKVILVSKDINLRVKADSVGITAEDYNDEILVQSPESIYSGTCELEIEGPMIDKMMSAGRIEASGLGDFFPNQYVHLKDVKNSKHTGMARYDSRQNALMTISTFKDVWGISSRNMNQAFALDALFRKDISLVTLIGKAGTGKTLMAVASAVSQLLDLNAYKKIVMSRPVVPLGRDLGYLPGDIDQKMLPYIKPLMDNLELLFSGKSNNFLDMQMEDGKIIVEALTYMRGRSIPNSLVIVDEVQNISAQMIKMVLTRISEGSKVILTGDIEQIDNVYLDPVNNGLSYVVEKFKDKAIAASVTLDRGERSELATMASELL